MAQRAVELQTTLGTFTVELYDRHAPRTCNNFAQLAAKGYYNGTLVNSDFLCLSCAATLVRAAADLGAVAGQVHRIIKVGLALSVVASASWRSLACCQTHQVTQRKTDCRCRTS